jgi:chromosome segregation ATPase
MDGRLIIELLGGSVTAAFAVIGILIIRQAYQTAILAYREALCVRKSTLKDSEDEIESLKHVTNRLQAIIDEVRAELRECQRDHQTARLRFERAEIRITHLEGIQ